MYSQPCGPMPSTTACGAGVADGEAHPGPPDEVEPPAGRPVQDGVPGDRLAAGRDGEVGLRARSSPGRRTGPCRRSRSPGRRAVSSTPAPVNAPNDWPAAPRSSSRTGPRSSPRSRAPVSPAPNERSAVDRRSPRRADRALVAERGRDPDLERRGRRVTAGAGRQRRIGAAGGDRRPTAPRRRPAPARRGRPARAAAAAGSRRRSRRPSARRPRPARGGGPRRGPGSSARPSRACPVNLARRSSRWVAMPVGHVSRWHWRAMSQPTATSAPVPNANSSAPSSAATSRSRPVCRPPSVRSATRSRRSLRSRTWWTSASPSSHGAPTCLIDDSGDAPVPPAWPDRWMYVAPALATPAAIVPTPRDRRRASRRSGRPG